MRTRSRTAAAVVHTSLALSRECARNTSAIYKIDRRSGKVIWRLGGKKSDFSMGKGTQFGFQHDARVHEGGRTLSLFDNGPRSGEGKPESRAIVLSLDTRRMQAPLKHEKGPSCWRALRWPSEGLINGMRRWPICVKCSKFI